MSIDRTLAVLWCISGNEDKEVREAVTKAINAIEELEKENLDLKTQIRKIKEYVRDINYK